MAVAMINNTSYETLADAVTAAKSIDGDVVITLISDIEFSSSLTISKNITINGKHTILRAKTYLGTFMTINAGVTLVLNDAVIDENHNWSFDREGYDELLYSGEKATTVDQFTTKEENSPVVTNVTFVVKGTLIVDGVTVQNKFGKATVFQAANGSFLITSNSTFKHIHSSTNNTVASIASGATWIINDGTLITGNHAGGNGGICRGDGHIIMNGGIIENNTAINANGTVFMFYGTSSYFEMNGGIIRYNSGIAGVSNGRNAAVYLHNASTMVMNDGLIEVNVGFSCGGIDAPYTNRNSSVTIHGGSVINNETVGDYESNDIRGAGGESDAIIIYGGTFTQDVNQYCADGFSVQLQGDGSYSAVSHTYLLYACINGEIKSVEAYTCVNGTIVKIEEIGHYANGTIIKN